MPHSREADRPCTGSVNQRGQIQAIGGRKLRDLRVLQSEGFHRQPGRSYSYAQCANPYAREVVNTVHGGKFHVWAVKTIEEGEKY